MRFATLPSVLVLLAPLTASAQDVTATNTQTSTSTLTVTRTLYTISATATSILPLVPSSQETTFLSYPDIQKPTGTELLGDIAFATTAPSTVQNSVSISAPFPSGTGTGVIPSSGPKTTGTGPPITFPGAAPKTGPQFLGMAALVGLVLSLVV